MADLLESREKRLNAAAAKSKGIAGPPWLGGHYRFRELARPVRYQVLAPGALPPEQLPLLEIILNKAGYRAYLEPLMFNLPSLRLAGKDQAVNYAIEHHWDPHAIGQFLLILERPAEEPELHLAPNEQNWRYWQRLKQNNLILMFFFLALLALTCWRYRQGTLSLDFPLVSALLGCSALYLGFFAWRYGSQERSERRKAETADF